MKIFRQAKEKIFGRNIIKFHCFVHWQLKGGVKEHLTFECYEHSKTKKRGFRAVGIDAKEHVFYHKYILPWLSGGVPPQQCDGVVEYFYEDRTIEEATYEPLPDTNIIKFYPRGKKD